jgi:hypothetical protein
MLAILFAANLMSQPLQPTVALAPTLQRFYPSSPITASHELRIDAARGERVSFQIAVRTQDDAVEVSATVDPTSKFASRVRRVGYVPLAHLNTGNPLSEIEGADHTPGLVPDPLFDTSKFVAGPRETNAFWVNLTIPSEAKPGAYRVPVDVQIGDAQHVACTAIVTVHNLVLKSRHDFPVTHWFYCDALSDFYHFTPFDDASWPVIEKYIRDLVEHGNDVMHTPVFTPSTDGVKKPTQLLLIKRDGERYKFDWSRVKRFVDLAKGCGMKRFEWAHFFSQWGCKNAIRIYQGDPMQEKLLWPADTAATAPVYRDFLAQYIPELERFLDQEGIRDVSYFHISDEPHGDEALANYRVARKMMRELAPWMKFMDALSQLSFAKEGLVDMPIPILDEAPAFVAAGYPAWCYFCGGPRGEYLNREMDTPLTKIRMSGWLFYRLKSKGFLHWGYNYWYKSQTREMIDPFTEQAGGVWPGWAYGDTFVVYPGPDGPIDSIRWEVFAESLQDYALLQSAGISPDDPLLGEITDYAHFPKHSDWVISARKALFDRSERRP